MWVNCLTHTVTHTRKGRKSTGEEALPLSDISYVLFLLTSLVP